MSTFKHHSYFAKAKQVQAFRFPYVCFGCRKAFKQPATAFARSCPQCGEAMTMLSRKFSAPRSNDLPQWKKVQFLVEHGFKFYSVYEPSEHGGQKKAKYPDTLQEAKLFVQQFSSKWQK